MTTSFMKRIARFFRRASPEFTVSFGRIARTLVYKDALGGLCFVFDVGPNEDQPGAKPNLYLSQWPLTENRRVLECRTQQEKERVELALQRTKQFVTSCGYEVYVIYDQARRAVSQLTLSAKD